MYLKVKAREIYLLRECMDNVLGIMSGAEVSPSLVVARCLQYMYVHVHNVSVNFLIGCLS